MLLIGFLFTIFEIFFCFRFLEIMVARTRASKLNNADQEEANSVSIQPVKNRGKVVKSKQTQQDKCSLNLFENVAQQFDQLFKKYDHFIM